jgi:hypothetical protein
MGIIHFHNNTSIQTNKIFHSLKFFKENEDVSFFKYIIFLKIDEDTYLLSLKSKLTRLHIFKR